MPGIEFWARGERAANANSIPQKAPTPIQNAVKSASQLNLSPDPPGQLQLAKQPVINNTIPQFAEPPPVRGTVNLGPAPKLAVQVPLLEEFLPSTQKLADTVPRGVVNLRPPLPNGIGPITGVGVAKAAGAANGILGPLVDLVNPATSDPAGDPSGFGFPEGIPGGASVSAPAAGNPFGMPQNGGTAIGGPAGGYANGPGWYVRSRFESQVDENGAVGQTEEVIGFIATFGSVASVTMGAMISDGAPWVNPNAQEILTTSGLGVTEVWGRSGLSFYHRLLSAVVEQVGAQPSPFPPSRPGDTPYWSASNSPSPDPYSSPGQQAPSPSPIPTPTPQRQPQAQPQNQPGGGLPRFLPDPTPLPPLFPRSNPNPNPTGTNTDPAFPTPLPLAMPQNKPAVPGAKPLLNPATGTATDLTPKVDRPPTPQPNISCSDPCMVNVQANQANQAVAQNAANSKLDQLTALLTGAGNIADIGMINKLNGIDAKLGPQLPGGLSGKLGRMTDMLKKTYSFLQVDRVLNVLTYTTTLHNAMMLSSSLSQTLFSAIGNTLNVFGLGDLQEDGTTTPFDVSTIVSKWTDGFFKSIFGVATVDGIKAEWKKWNRIYQAAANVVWSIQSIGHSILGVLEIIGSWNAKIGNALKKYGAVGERAYPWMNQQPNFQNRAFTAMQNVEDVVSQIDGVSSEVLSAQQTITEIGKTREDLVKTVSEDATKPKGPVIAEATVKKAAEDAAKTNSASAPITSDTLVKPAT